MSLSASTVSYSASSGTYRTNDAIESSEVLQDAIPWKAYHTAKLITDDELMLISKYDKKPEEVQKELLNSKGSYILQTFITVLTSTTKEQVVRYVLAVIDKIISDERKLVSSIFDENEEFKKRVPDVFIMFTKHLNRTDWFVQEKSCKILTDIITLENEAFGGHGPLHYAYKNKESTSTSERIIQAAMDLMDWLLTQLRRPSSQSKSVPIAVSCLPKLLRCHEIRKSFHKQGGIVLLAPIIRLGISAQTIPIQVLYDTGVCTWLCSYLPDCHKAIVDCGIPRALVGLIRLNIKEKVTRIALSALKNLLCSEEIDITADMVDAGLVKLVQIRLIQNWGDEDVITTLEFLNERLKTGIEILSNYDKYKKEVLSGRLDWGPMHTEESFWKLNIDRFDEKEFSVLKALLSLLEVSRESKTLAIGCHDLGQFVTYHPHGRFIVNDLRGKEIVMELMRHTDEEVKKNALLCVQKIMLNKSQLDFLSVPT